jgi:hypothetical protein
LMNNALDIFSVSSEMKQRKGKDTCLSWTLVEFSIVSTYFQWLQVFFAGDLSHYCQKHVALKLTYQGERYFGFI